MTIRFIDFLISIFLLFLLSPLFLFLFFIGLLDTGSPIFSQERLGKLKKPFCLYKFRSMDVSTDSVGTHLVDKAKITRFGRFLRRTKLDELPQLINVIKGEMSLVGPRPNLTTQNDLINQRESKGIYNVKPGITGLAQINNIDMSNPELLAIYDAKMIASLSLITYFKYLILTLLGKGQGDKVQ